jgi:adenylate kinase
LPKTIILTGTPGVGKTVIGKLLAKETRSTFLSLGDVVRSGRLHKGFDPRAGSYIIDERAVERKLRGYFEDHGEKGIVFETHFVSTIIHKSRGMVAVVLRLDPVVLARRLRARNWPKRKIWEKSWERQKSTR